MTPELFLLDIDGTLINSQRHVTKRTYKVISQLLAKGFKLSLCTGRPFVTTPQEILALFPAENLHIFATGANIATSLGETLIAKRIDSKIVKQIAQTVDQLEGAYFFAQGKTKFVNQKSWVRSVKYGTDNLQLTTDDKKDWQATTIGVIDLNPKICNFIENLPEISFKKLINYEGEEYYDITALGVNKAWGAKKLAEHLEINLANVIAIGDSSNDLEVIELVGKGIAMGNATDELKATAKETIDHVDSNGLAKYLEKFI